MRALSWGPEGRGGGGGGGGGALQSPKNFVRNSVEEDKFHKMCHFE